MGPSENANPRNLAKLFFYYLKNEKRRFSGQFLIYGKLFRTYLQNSLSSRPEIFAQLAELLGRVEVGGLVWGMGHI